MAVEVYRPARIQLFMQIRDTLSFDVYLRLTSDKITKIFKKGDRIDRQRVSNYLHKGVEHFYVHGDEAQDFLRTSHAVLESILKAKAFKNDVAEKIVDDVATQALQQIWHSQSFDDAMAKTVVTLVSSYIEIAAHQPQILPNLIRLARDKPQYIRHGILSSLFSTLLARAKSPNDFKLQLVSGLSGFLHDIGHAFLSEDIDELSLELGPVQRKELFRHPQLGADCLLSPELPAGVRTAVLQHHEAYDGTGYPMGLSGEYISLPARIIQIAGIFVRLTTGTESLPSLQVEVALHVMTNDPQLDPLLCQDFQKMLLLDQAVKH
jgi:HD-GYP domain-containing protein (c-di-GMP phosphodiesterase class II)